MPVKMHLGDPAYFWGDKANLTPYEISRGWYYGDGTYPSLEQLRDEVDGILQKFPRLKLCLAHFYFLGDNLEKAAEFFEKWENVAFDLTPGGVMFAGFTARHEAWREFFIHYADRIFFGSDTYNFLDKEGNLIGKRIDQVRQMMEWPAERQVDGDQHGMLTPLQLPEDVLQKIYHQNQRNLLGKARMIDAAGVCRAAEKLAAQLEAGEYVLGSAEELQLELKNLETVRRHFAG